MKLSRRQVAGGIGAASVAALGAVPAGAQQQVTLDVLYCLPSFARFHEPIAAEFMKKFPNIRIQFRAPATNYDEGHQAMLRAAVTNQLPVIPIEGALRIIVGITSYAEDLNIGITGDGEHATDVDVLLVGIQAGFDQILEQSTES